MKKLALLAVVTAVTLAAAGALAVSRGGAEPARTAQTAVAFMHSEEEVPSVSNPDGRGEFELTFVGTQTMSFRLSWSGLTGPPGAAHIHLGQRGANGGVSAFLCGGSTKPACPQATSGAISGTITPADVVGPASQGIAPGEWEELARAIRLGVTYANIHTQNFPGGELRGQIRGG